MLAQPMPYSLFSISSLVCSHLSPDHDKKLCCPNAVDSCGQLHSFRPSFLAVDPLDLSILVWFSCAMNPSSFDLCLPRISNIVFFGFALPLLVLRLASRELFVIRVHTMTLHQRSASLLCSFLAVFVFLRRPVLPCAGRVALLMIWSCAEADLVVLPRQCHMTCLWSLLTQTLRPFSTFGPSLSLPSPHVRVSFGYHVCESTHHEKAFPLTS